LISNIYGSSRVGIKNTNKRVTALAYNIQGGVSDIIIPETINPLDPVKRSLGEKQYELSNHLGNVLVTVSDRKLAEGTEGSTATGYRAEVLFASDYYPFGMLEQSGDPDWSKAERHGQMPGREYSAEEYRYGFQGQETDKEWLGGAVSYKYRVHDARIGRFLSVDPLAPDYPHNSPYAFSENRVIDGVELEGLEWESVKDDQGNVTEVQLNVDLQTEGLTNAQVEAYKAGMVSYFDEFFQNSTGGQVSGRLMFNQDPLNDGVVPKMSLKADMYPEGLTEDDLVVVGQTTGYIMHIQTRNKFNQFLTPEEFAPDGIHEIMHTARIGHPFEITQSIDTELLLGDGVDLITTVNTDSNIALNVMMYGHYSINGTMVSESIKNSKFSTLLLTGGQINYLMKEIEIQKNVGAQAKNPLSMFWNFGLNYDPIKKK
jgi:RHS repeat-associated protein